MSYAMPAAFPKAAAFANARAAVVGGARRAPRHPRTYCRSLAAACDAAGYGAGRKALTLRLAYACHVAGRPITWPAALPAS